MFLSIDSSIDKEYLFIEGRMKLIGVALITTILFYLFVGTGTSISIF